MGQLCTYGYIVQELLTYTYIIPPPQFTYLHKVEGGEKDSAF
jgi:hypothetical protein